MCCLACIFLFIWILTLGQSLKAEVIHSLTDFGINCIMSTVWLFNNKLIHGLITPELEPVALARWVGSFLFPDLSPLWMKSSLGISDFLEETSSLSHSFVFPYFFELITEEGFLISMPLFGTMHSNEFIFPFLFCLKLFPAICKASDNHFAFLHFFFLEMILITASCTL